MSDIRTKANLIKSRRIVIGQISNLLDLRKSIKSEDLPKINDEIKDLRVRYNQLNRDIAKIK